MSVGTTRDDAVRRLGRALDEGVDRAMAGASMVSVLFSGGIDSSLIAFSASRRLRPTLVTIGLPGSADVEFVGTLLGELPAAHHLVELGNEEIARVSEELESELAGLGTTSRSVAVALGLALRHSPDALVLCGQGADEQFLGYAHFRGLDAPSAGSLADSDLRRLLVEDWPRALRIAQRYGHSLSAPFLDDAVMEVARSIPLAERLPDGPAKRPLRDLARSWGLPPSVCDRPKRAIQFASGVDKLLRVARDR